MPAYIVTCIYTLICVHIWVSICLCMHIYKCVCVCVHACVCVWVCVCKLFLLCRFEKNQMFELLDLRSMAEKYETTKFLAFCSQLQVKYLNCRHFKFLIIQK